MSADLETIKNIVADIIDVEADELGEDDSLPEQHDVDSLLGLEILVALEKKFKIKIPESMLQEMTTVRKIASELNTKIIGVSGS